MNTKTKNRVPVCRSVPEGVRGCHLGAFWEHFGEPFGINLGRFVLIMGSCGLDFNDFAARSHLGAFGKHLGSFFVYIWADVCS